MTGTKTYDHVQTMDDIQRTFQTFALLAMTVSDEDVQQAREAIAMAESVGFVVDPTKYRDAMQRGSLERQQRLVRLFEHTRNELKAIFPAGWET